MVGTLQPHSDFDVTYDCENLREAMHGAGTDEDALIAILCHRSAEQRVEICTAYKQMYGKDLVDEVKSETSKNFEEVLVSLLQPTARFLASICKNAIDGAGTSEGALINVLVGATKDELEDIKEAYKLLKESTEIKELENDVISDVSGSLQRVLVSLLQGARDDSDADMDLAVKDAEELFNAGDARLGTDESVFNKVLCSRSPQHLKLVFRAYRQVSGGQDIETAIKGEMSGSVEDAFLAIARIIKDKEMYFAEQLYKSMKGLGTNDEKLIRLMVWRSEIDLVEIKEHFSESYGSTLEEFISGDCGGDYKEALLALC